ncbi:hypothetical protein K7X08_019282 [Anisodus acutangulus]|uniref:Aminotransferase-like plant mobile domain-containing protein n=1 Tax=Anisodus acutangulus TaxID=402998 RepID=A0A9Q1RPW0_9SOLA|nr:hypothetical protein K7X08_019282 [Anisodus acutangulus]
MPSSDCEQSHSAIIDVVILIAVVSASGVLLYPYVNLLVHKLFEFFGAVSCVVKDEILRAPMVFICLGLSILFAVIALLAITVCTTGKGCGKPGCRRLRKAAEFDIQLETEDCLKKSNFSAKNGVKKGLFKLPRDHHHQELEAELKRMAPPNGRAVLVFRGMDLPRMTLHPGSEEYDVLIIQEKHRSHGVWNEILAGHKAYLSPRRADREFWKHVRRHPLHPRILDYFDNCEFRGVVEVEFIPYDWRIITALIERRHPETHTFHLCTGKATITLQDIELMFGMSVDGDPLFQANARNINLRR